MFRKIIALLLTVVLTASIAVAGTVAYLQYEDSDVNVMTLGNVAIDQHEYERVVNEDGSYKTKDVDGQNSYELQDFTQDKPLYPIVGDPSVGDAGWDETIVRMTQVDSYGNMQVFAGKNAQDKFVTVENTGKSDAYIRTFVAIEIGKSDGTLLGTSHHNTWDKENLGVIEIDGNNYVVFAYTYKGGQLSDGTWRHENGILPAGDTSYPNLAQVYIKSAATNEDIEAIDGNDNGKLDIIVLSQAIQTAGFDTAAAAFEAAFPMGDNNVNVASWLGGVLVEHQKPPVVIVDSGTWGGIDWTLDDAGVLTVSPAKNPVPDKDSGKEFKSGEWREAVIYKSNGDASAIGGYPYDVNAVKSLVIEDGVTSIGSFAAKFPNLTGEVVIPSTVTYIGQEAFQKTGITKLTFAEGGTEPLCIAPGAFKSLAIEELVLPAGREVHVHCWAFNDCLSLKRVTIPANVTTFACWTHVDYCGMDYVNSWDSQVFARCTALESITFGSQEVHDLFFNSAGNRKNINDIGGVEIIVKS